MPWQKSALVVAFMVGCFLSDHAFAQYAPVGVQADVPETTVIAGGWNVCHSSTFAESGTSLASIQDSCDKTNVMLACRPVGASNFTLLAQATRADVFTETGDGNTPHDANGVGWYYDDNSSWGFAPQGEPIDRDSCDINAGASRMCIHTRFGVTDDGYRCGDDTDDLNDDPTWERVVLESRLFDPAPGVRFGDAGVNEPVVVAAEIVIPPTRTITNFEGTLDIITSVDYAFAPGEVRYARVQCGVGFVSGTTVSLSGDPGNTVGAINGIGTDAVYFSITAGANPITAGDLLTIGGDRSIPHTLSHGTGAACNYGLYDQPSQAQAGGREGRIAETGGFYMHFLSSYGLVVETTAQAIADVESDAPSYSRFTLPSPTGDPAVAQLGSFSVGPSELALGYPRPIGLDGQPLDVEDLVTDGTAVVFAGDFSAAASAFVSVRSDCGPPSVSIEVVDDASAMFLFPVEVRGIPPLYLCYVAGDDPIPASAYTVALDAVAADPANYAAPDVAAQPLGEIVRNGMQLQAPLVQTPNAWVSRIVLTNTGSLERAYEISVMGETGNIIGVDSTLLVGTVPANGTKVVELDDVLLSFSGDHRATLNVTIAAPDNQIQGLYQIVNPDSGSISNHVMVRPATN